MSEHIAGVIRRYYTDLWSMGNVSTADDIFAPDVTLFGPEHPDGVRGIEAIKREVTATRKAFPDLRLTVDRQVIQGDRVMVRWTMLGTQSGEYRGLSPTDRIILLSGVDLLYVAGGQNHNDMELLRRDARLSAAGGDHPDDEGAREGGVALVIAQGGSATRVN